MGKIIDRDYEELIGADPEDIVIGGQGPGHELLALGGAFEGVDRINRELASWYSPIQHPDQEIIPQKATADGRSRDISRNDAYVHAGITTRQDSIVGEFYFLNSKPNWKVLELDETWATEFQEEVENKFTLWAEGDQHWPDASRINTLTSFIRLAVGIHAAGGEVLATAEWLRDLPRPFNSAMQMIDPDRLSTPMGAPETSRLRGGVEKNVFGAPQAYHIRMAHPADSTSMTLDQFRWKRVPVRKPWGRPQVLHIHEQLRPDQTRGISEMVAALMEMKMTRNFRKITLQNAVVNATYAASIESELPAETVYAAMGAGNTDKNPIIQYAKAFLAAIGQYSGSSKNMQIDGIKIPHLFPGTKLQLRPAGTPGGVGTDFEHSLLRYIAANLGVSYEQLSKDFSKTNYSGFKAGLNETHKFMRSKKRLVADRTANFLYRLWLEEALNKGEITAMPSGRPEGWYYEGLMMEALLEGAWIGAGVGMIDELKETQAAILRLNNNLSTHEEEIARRGGDYRKVFAQKQREREDMVERDIIPISQDPAINAASGTPSDTGDSPRGPDSGNASAPGAEASVPSAPITVNVEVPVTTPRAGSRTTHVTKHDARGRILEFVQTEDETEED